MTDRTWRPETFLDHLRAAAPGVLEHFPEHLKPEMDALYANPPELVEEFMAWQRAAGEL